MATSSQKFIARNRAPRVQIEYDVELYGAEKKIQLLVKEKDGSLTAKDFEPAGEEKLLKKKAEA